MPVAELGQRSTTQAQLQNAPRLGVEQQEGHHFAGVRQAQRVGIVEPHDALHVVQVEVQVTQRTAVFNERLGVGSVDQLLEQFGV